MPKSCPANPAHGVLISRKAGIHPKDGSQLYKNVCLTCRREKMRAKAASSPEAQAKTEKVAVVAAYFSEHPGATVKEAVKDLGISRQSVVYRAGKLGINLRVQSATERRATREVTQTAQREYRREEKLAHAISCSRSGCGWSGAVVAYAGHYCKPRSAAAA